jgi:hypothetical protein
MRAFLVALTLLLMPMAAFAQEEDAAHRDDRRQTADLNRGAAHVVDRRNAVNAAALARYREEQAAYQRERAAWRRRFAACEAGDERACDPG